MRTTGSQPLLERLPAEVLRALQDAGATSTYQDGQTIHDRGAEQPGLSLILAGRVRFGAFAEDGTYVSTTIMEEGSFFGEVTLFSGGPRAYHAEAFGKTRILNVPKGPFERVLAAHPGLTLTLLEAVTERLYEALEIIDDLRLLPLEQRVAKQLLRLSASGFRGESTLPIRHIDLAFALGLSRVSVGKALSSLEERGLISLGYRQISIHDPSALRAFGPADH